MANESQNIQKFQEDSTSGGTPKGKTLTGRILEPSSSLICFLSSLCATLLLVTIILLVTITRHGVGQTEQSLEKKLRELREDVASKVEQLSTKDQGMTVRLNEIDRAITELKRSEVPKKVKEIEDLVDQMLSEKVLGSLASDVQRILVALGHLTEEIHKSNSSSDPVCGKGWTHNGTSCYFRSDNLRSWEESKKACEGMKAGLVVINNEDEMDFVRDFSQEQSTWIGFRKEGLAWKWLDGTPQKTTFWLPGRPDNSEGWSSGNEVCAHMSQGGWNDNLCSRRNTFICERKP